MYIGRLQSKLHCLSLSRFVRTGWCQWPNDVEVRLLGQCFSFLLLDKNTGGGGGGRGLWGAFINYMGLDGGQIGFSFLSSPLLFLNDVDSRNVVQANSKYEIGPDARRLSAPISSLLGL